jgi:tetratricopeptide (TPR) repeat protein
MLPGPRLVIALPVLIALMAAGVWLQRERDRRFRTDRPAEQLLYVRSPDVVKRLALSYDALAADVYWIRALQHFGGTRRSEAAVRRYELLYPLLDMATSLDPYFNIAYRFGAVFLAEPAPGGPGRPDQAIRLLEKGLQAMPDKWQYMQDAGFVHYWSMKDYTKAAAWFRRAADVPGAPAWLQPLAAVTLAQGGNRTASRLLFRSIAESSEERWLREDARWRLRQLDALDALDALDHVVSAYRARGGTAPFTWPRLVQAGWLRAVPHDPDGFPFVIDPLTGLTDLHARSTLRPLPVEPVGPPSDAAPRRPVS